MASLLPVSSGQSQDLFFFPFCVVLSLSRNGRLVIPGVSLSHLLGFVKSSTGTNPRTEVSGQVTPAVGYTVVMYVIATAGIYLVFVGSRSIWSHVFHHQQQLRA